MSLSRSSVSFGVERLNRGKHIGLTFDWVVDSSVRSTIDLKQLVIFFSRQQFAFLCRRFALDVGDVGMTAGISQRCLEKAALTKVASRG